MPVIAKDDRAVTAMAITQSRPNARCGPSPLRRKRMNGVKARAASAAARWIFTSQGAARIGASVIGSSPFAFHAAGVEQGRERRTRRCGEMQEPYVKDTPAQVALRETRATFSNLKALAAMAAAVALLALAGPFGTDDALAFVPRLAYWAFTVPITYATGSLVGTCVLVAMRRSRPFWQAMPAAAIAAGLVITGVVALLNWITFGSGPELLPLSAIFLASAIVTGAVIVLSHELERETEARPVPPPLLERLDFAKRGPLLSLSVQDHYVEVVTTRGTSLILMRLSD